MLIIILKEDPAHDIIQQVKVDAPVPLIFFPKIKCLYSQGVGERIDPGPKVLLVVPCILYTYDVHIHLY